VGGGVNNKKHILAPVETRLSLFTSCCINRATEKITESFRLSNSHLGTKPRYDKTAEIKYLKKNYNTDGTIKEKNQLINSDKAQSDLSSLNETTGITDIVNREMPDQEKVEIDLNNLENSSNLEVVSTTPVWVSDKGTENQDTERDSKTDNSNNNSSSIFLKNNNIGDRISFKKREYHTACHSAKRNSISPCKGASLISTGVKHRDTNLFKNKTHFYAELEYQFRSKSSTASNRQERSVTASNQLIESRSPSSEINKQSPLSFLESLGEVIKNSQSDPKKAQLHIEKLSIESEKNKLEDPDYFLTRHSYNFHKLVLEAKVTLNILNENNELKLKFPFFDGELNKLEYLLLTFSLGITYYGRLD